MPSLRNIGRVDATLDSLTALFRLPEEHKVVRAFMDESMEPPQLVIMIEGPTMPPHLPGQVVQNVKLEMREFYAKFA